MKTFICFCDLELTDTAIQKWGWASPVVLCYIVKQTFSDFKQKLKVCPVLNRHTHTLDTQCVHRIIIEVWKEIHIY